ncbi:MAG: kelch repeat-containing protein [Blastocatellia bacterium]
MSYSVSILRRAPRAFLTIALVSCITILFNERVRQLVNWPGPARAIDRTAQDSGTVLTGRELRRAGTARQRRGKTAPRRESNIQPAIVAPSLTTAREQHIAIQLLNGKLLVAGGRNASGALGAAQLYDPATGSWSDTGGLGAARYGHAAVLLQSGKVLVAGGRDTSGNYLASAELYDPASGSWAATGSLATGRSRATLTLLRTTPSSSPNGKALIVAGEGAGGASLRTAELYDPVSGSWSPASGLNEARREHTATLLANGRVLVAGGLNGGVEARVAEIYSPITNSWSGAGLLRTARSRHTATALVDGRVLVAGGENAGAPIAGAELYNPSTNVWLDVLGALSQPRRSHSATLLANGKVLVAGGFGTTALGSFQIFDPARQTWSGVSNLANARANHTATLLANGAVLLAGGGLENNSAYLSSVEILEFNSPSWSDADSFSVARERHTATLLGNGKILVAGGYAFRQTRGDAQLYDPVTNSWSATGSMNATRDTHTATLLSDGRVLVTGGLRFLGPNSLVLSAADLYDPRSGQWTQANQITTPRFNHTATLLLNGKVLVAGGLRSSGNTLSSAELYDPATGQWTPTGGMTELRESHTATLLPNGKVLAVGGSRNNVPLRSAELYDPTTGSWSRTGAGQLSIPRDGHTATLLPNGKALVTGGASVINTNPLMIAKVEDTAELFDPVTGSWTLTPAMSVRRYLHTATLLISGKVLVAGGIAGDVRNDANFLNTAELFDPATNTWSQTTPLSDPRANFRATPLPNGQVLATGGVAGFSDTAGNFLDTAERYDPGLGFSDEMRPVVGRVSVINNAFALTGVRFQSASEGSSGNSGNSAGNFPVVQARDIESGQVRALTPGASGWSNKSFTSQALPASALTRTSLITVISNGVPSLARLYPSGAPGASQTVSIGGRVTTRNGEGFRATLRIVSSLGEARVTQTNANGEYNFPALPTTTAPTPTPTVTPTPTPTITPTPTPSEPFLRSMNPHSRQVNSGSFTMQVTGSGFTSNSRMRFQGALLNTNFLSSTTLSATVPASAIAAEGSYSITVANGALISNALCFTVTPAPGASIYMVITSLSPSSMLASTISDVGPTITINGVNLPFPGNFGTGVARWNGSDRPTTRVSSTQMRVTLMRSDVFAPGTGVITIYGTVNDGPFHTSNPLCFTITPLGPPVVVGNSLAPRQELRQETKQENITYTVTPMATTPDGRPVTFSPPSLTFSNLSGDINNANFLVTGPPVDIRGAVKTSSGSPLPQVAITLNFKDPDTGDYQLFDVMDTNAEGLFTFTGLTPGYTYRILAQMAGYDFSFPGKSDEPVYDIPNLIAGIPDLMCRGQMAVNPTAFEADVGPRPNGNGVVTVSDWVMLGRFVAGIETPAAGGEYQRADCGPRATAGDGRLTVSDWAQAGRYAVGLDPPAMASGPTAPATSFDPAGNFGSSLAFPDFTAQLLKWINRPDTRTLRMRTENGRAGDVYSITIEIEAHGGENAAGFSLIFDPRRWRVSSIAAGRDAKTARIFFNTNDADDGRVGIALAAPPGEGLIGGIHQLVTIAFAPLIAEGAESPLIGFGDEPIAREITDAEANPLPVSFALNDDSPLTVIPAADFDQDVLLNGSLVAAFGRDLAGVTLAAGAEPFPTTLGGIQALVRDSQGVERLAPILFVSPRRINFQVPAETAPGPAQVKITDGNHRRATTVVKARIK